MQWCPNPNSVPEPAVNLTVGILLNQAQEFQDYSQPHSQEGLPYSFGSQV